MIKTININEIPAINKGYIMQDIEDFLNSGDEACEVFGSEKTSLQTLHSSYASAVKKNGYSVANKLPGTSPRTGPRGGMIFAAILSGTLKSSAFNTTARL